MKRIGLFWGSQTGNTELAATLIVEAIGSDIVQSYDIRGVDSGTFGSYDSLILGTSTWGAGELQDDWDSFLPQFDAIDFIGKKVALFGLGDQLGYGDYFLDGMGILYENLIGRGAKVTGSWSVDGYEHSYSRAIQYGAFVGLALDADNQNHLTPVRIKQWVDQILPILL
ncbi:flavodoxin [Chlorobium phaeobacteroides]|uniref:Flavodoxin n=1 Tax=Chlorobium phaeobacteroides (strain DSM 266 / SMG 266 / 2430) TaxID=290317 RepID=A1BDA9_CHLPD|nr:flavodoxin [Chlorobium phaeobacteroides]ABL64386.1 flavodoxin [Chlorobium phaeobacteroides DSM 266]